MFTGNGRNTRVRVAIVGVGNCANALIQGVFYYRDAPESEEVPGLMHVNLGGYHVGDIEFVAAFDVDADKVGRDLSEAIWRGQNNTIRFADVPYLGVPVLRGPTLDGVGRYLAHRVEESDARPVDVRRVLEETQADVLVNYLPVAANRPRASMPNRPWPRASPSSTPSPSSSPAIPSGESASAPRGSPSSAMTSNPRSAPPSCTAPWPNSFWIGGCAWNAPAN